MSNITIFSEYCCGCGECSCICPVHAIQMKKNSKGFLVPVVATENCIKCGKCVKECAFNNDQISEK